VTAPAPAPKGRAADWTVKGEWGGGRGGSEERATERRGKAAGPAPRRRIAILLRWYPANWRARYGDEFAELLVADLAERPRCWRRTADVAVSGTLARLSQAGLGGQRLAPADQARASLAALGGALAVFLTAGTAVWSQLLIGWQWAPPSTRAAAVATVVMTVALLFFLVLAVLAAVPVGWQLARRGFGGGPPGRARLILIAVSLLVLIIGGRHMANGWPGTGGHPWPQRGLVPGGVAAFGWATTLSVSSYWAHPAALAAFPAGEIAWMAGSPAALAGLAAGLSMTVRRLGLPARVLRYQARLGAVAAGVMAVFLAGAACWVLAGGPGPRNLFRPGAIDVLALVMMALALAAGWQALHRAWAAGPPRSPLAGPAAGSTCPPPPCPPAGQR
jgi:hypothetical protein